MVSTAHHGRLHSWLLAVLLTTSLALAAGHVHPSTGEDRAAQPAPPDLLSPSNPGTLDIPIKVTVLLVGFRGDGGRGFEMNSELLATHLERLLPMRQPSELTPTTQRRLPIRYRITYEVRDTGSDAMRQMEKAIGRAGVLAAPETRLVAAPTVNIQTDRVTGALEDILHTRTASPDSPTIIVLNPNKGRIKQEIMNTLGMSTMQVTSQDTDASSYDEQFVYRYQWPSRSYSTSWVGRGQYLVVDLMAGPVQFGFSKASDGNVGPSTMPTVPQHPSDHHRALFAAELASIIASGIRHVIAPDVLVSGLAQADIVLVPIVVLRDHSQTDVTRHIDVKLLKETLSQLLLPKQSVQILLASHRLDDHPHLAQAIAKSRRMDSVLAPNKAKGWDIIHQECFDSKWLAEALSESADELTAGLLRSASDLPEWLIQQQHNGPIAPSRHEEMRSRIIPVYVLSLAHHRVVDDIAIGHSRLPLLDHTTLLSVAQDTIVTLQLPQKSVTVPFTSDDRPISINSDAALTRLILAGLLNVFGGISTPVNAWDAVRNQSRSHWLWAHGAHPFGPFSGTPAVSRLLQHNAVRNTLIVHLDNAVRAVHTAILALGVTIDKYSLAPVHEASEIPNVLDWLRRVTEYDIPLADHSPINYDMARLLHVASTKLHAKASSLSALQWDADLAAVAAVLDDFSASAEGTTFAPSLESRQNNCSETEFSSFVSDTIAYADDAMRCCKTQHSTRMRGISWSVTLGLIVVAAGIGLGATYVLCAHRWRTKKAKWD